MALSKEDILATGSAKVEKIQVPEWGGEVYIRVMKSAEGKRLFTDADAPVLGEKLAPALDRIFEAASKLNRLSKEDVEELEKNSESPQPGE
jgi:hypothetical protein